MTAGARISQRPGRLDLALVRGDDAELELLFVNAAGAAVNLAGRAFELRLTGATTATLDGDVDTTAAAIGRLAIPLAGSLIAAVSPRTWWYLRDTTNDRTLLDGEVVAYAPGQAGVSSGSITETVVVGDGAAEVTVTASVAAPGILVLAAGAPAPAGYVGLIARRPA